MAQVSAIIPAHNEHKTIAGVINSIVHYVNEVIVVDSCCDDDTRLIARKCGAEVIKVRRPGKHYALRAGVLHSRGEELIFLDADWINPDSNMVTTLLSGLRSNSDVTIAKGYYDRSTASDGYQGGRLTELCARPLINFLVPELSAIKEPLSGEFAVRRKHIIDMKFAPGFAVDLGFLLHCSNIGRIYQVKLQHKLYKHRSLNELGKAATEVAATILRFKGMNLTEIVLRQFIKNVEIKSLIDLRPLPSIEKDLSL